MKARFRPVVLSLAACLSSFGAAYAAEPAEAPFVFVDSADPAVAEIRLAGERTIDSVGNAMMVEIKRELADKSPALALGALHLKNYRLPAAVPGKPAVTAVRRTSLRVRDPANAPDAADAAALARIQYQLEQGNPVSALILQKVTPPDRSIEWRAYRPLVTLKPCLDCHGTERALAPGVIDALKLFFPGDIARDYHPGEWRGVIRVSLTAPIPEKP